ncbi:isopentenyl phosphate kinase [Candidatus Marsarchaeota archaeon]|nr:isopentenyl phosphate kinase [Candidatus Marsarchaeota archaeon]
MEIIMIKLGGSVITEVDHPITPKISKIRELLREIKKSKRQNIIIGHGGGSFPHVPAHKYKIQEGLINSSSLFGTALTQKAASDLHSIIISEMLRLKMRAFSFSPSSSVVARGKRIMKWDVAPIKSALELGFVPVVYGDVAIDMKQGICITSTEEIFRYLSGKLKPWKIIIGTDVDGVFTSDPKASDGARLIKVITRDNLNKADFSNIRRKFDVTGSMRSKVLALYEMSRNSHAVCQIINANKRGRLYDAISGKKVMSTIIKG